MNHNFMNHNHDNAPNAGPRRVPVRFEFTPPTAITVSVAETFNHWQPEAKSLHPSGGGRWFKETASMHGIYANWLVVNGQWIPNPLARETVVNPGEPDCREKFRAAGMLPAQTSPSWRRPKFLN